MTTDYLLCGLMKAIASAFLQYEQTRLLCIISGLWV